MFLVGAVKILHVVLCTVCTKAKTAVQHSPYSSKSITISLFRIFIVSEQDGMNVDLPFRLWCPVWTVVYWLYLPYRLCWSSLHSGLLTFALNDRYCTMEDIFVCNLLWVPFTVLFSITLGRDSHRASCSLALGLVLRRVTQGKVRGSTFIILAYYHDVHQAHKPHLFHTVQQIATRGSQPRLLGFIYGGSDFTAALILLCRHDMLSMSRAVV